MACGIFPFNKMYRWRKDPEWWGLGTLSTPPPSVSTALQNASNQYGVPYPILQAVAQQESSYNPSAVSSAGAVGLMQIMPANYSSLGVTNPTDPQQSANAGAKYLSQLYSQYGNWNDALIAYNEGPGNFANQGVFPSSQAYADAILQNSGIQTPTPPLSDSSGGTGDGTDSSLFDLSSLQDSSGGLSPLAWAGIAAAALGVLWVAS